MGKLKVKYWRGWLNGRKALAIPREYWPWWEAIAIQEDDNGFNLVVFKLPKDRADELTADIERLLQTKIDGELL